MALTWVSEVGRTNRTTDPCRLPDSALWAGAGDLHADERVETVVRRTARHGRPRRPVPGGW